MYFCAYDLISEWQDEHRLWKTEKNLCQIIKFHEKGKKCHLSWSDWHLRMSWGIATLAFAKVINVNLIKPNCILESCFL